MSAYTDATSRPGTTTNPAGTDDRELFLTEFGGMVIQAYNEVMDYMDLRFVKQITQGKADTFPVIGRKRDATEHTPGEVILGGTIPHDEVEITLDSMLVDSVFIAEIDQLMLHYSLSEPYAKQLGQSLGSTTAKRIAIMHILASRNITDVPTGQPTPAYYWDAAILTNGAKLEDAAALTQQYLLENDISGDQPVMMLKHAQRLLLARYAGVEGGPVTTGSGNRSAGTVGPLMGLTLKGTNHIPSTNITTGLSKYRGNFTTTAGHVSSRMAVGSLERRAMRVTMTDKEDRLGTLLIASQFNGHGQLRRECSIELRSDAIGGRTGLGL